MWTPNDTERTALARYRCLPAAAMCWYGAGPVLVRAPIYRIVTHDLAARREETQLGANRSAIGVVLA
ncbi:hypothetical protein [Amycolatopsis minnesotensis]|uniref:Uncharacterized protein n=1 Tax=Amycolatopsis minnesotensis TaxID=337894 RepID=A0ABP5BHE4_9PSEU